MPIYAVSDQALDVNQYGKASSYMLEEISELPNMMIEIDIYGKSQHHPRPSFIFTHHWPKQELRPVEPVSYDPSIRLLYSTKVVFWDFAFDSNLTQLLLEPQDPTLNDPELYTPPQAVKVQDNNLIEVTLTKRLYTTEGWKTVQITTLYERFTKAT